jgi:hypothetical protein
MEDDFQGDGLINSTESDYGTNPWLFDTDSDGIDDKDEIDGTNGYVTNPAKSDTDDDGLSDSSEVDTHYTDPNDYDTDDDYLSDGWEVNNGFDPNDNSDPDNATMESDNDGDGVSLYNEGLNGTDPDDADSDDDGMPDKWEIDNDCDPLTDDNDVDVDGDGFDNLAEYLIGENPNEDTEQEPILAGVPVSSFDPAKGETAKVYYILSANADDVDISFKNVNTSETVRTISQTNVTANELAEAVWDGSDDGGDIVERTFYDVKIDVDSGQHIWNSPEGQDTPYNMSSTITADVNVTNFNPYKNIPAVISCNMSDWVKKKIDIVKSDYAQADFISGDKARIYHVSKNRLLSPGWNTFYWYGCWGDDIIDISDPCMAGMICEDEYFVYFASGEGIRTGAVAVYYEDLLTDLRCHPYRIFPLNDEVTTITYDLAADANVTIDVYDPDGQYFVTLLNSAAQDANAQQVKWYGKDGDPNSSNSRYISKEGVYRIEVEAQFGNVSEKREGSITVYK